MFWQCGVLKKLGIWSERGIGARTVERVQEHGLLGVGGHGLWGESEGIDCEEDARAWAGERMWSVRGKRGHGL